MCTATEKAYSVEGMTCGHCELSVSEAVEGLAGVLSAQTDRETGRLTVRGTGIGDEAVRQAVRAAGYTVATVRAPGVDFDEDFEVNG